MSKILAVFGATGQQGGSIIDYVLNDPELNQKYKIRAITRDTDSEKAKQLKKKVEVVHGDVLNPASLETALTGAHTVFAMTIPSFDPESPELEYNSGKTIADVAVEKGVEYIIFSTLPGVKEISGGKYTKVTPFDKKAKVEHYIRSLHNIKSAFYSPGYFMENYEAQPFLAPKKSSDGTWIIARNTSPQTQSPYLDCVGDSGKFVGAILAAPDKYEGKTFCAATALYTWTEVAAAMSKAMGKTVVYKQIPLEEFKKNLPFFPDGYGEVFCYQEEFGYYGPGTGELVAWAVENARGRLSTLEEYFERHPLRLV